MNIIKQIIFFVRHDVPHEIYILLVFMFGVVAAVPPKQDKAWIDPVEMNLALAIYRYPSESLPDCEQVVGSKKLSANSARDVCQHQKIGLLV
jgi:hypothetical protein